MLSYAMLAIFLPMIGAILMPFTGKNRKHIAVLFGTGTTAIAMGLLIKVWSINRGISASFPWAASIGMDFTVYLDPLSMILTFVAAIIGLMVIIYSTKYMEKEEGQGRYYFLVLMFIGGMIGLVSTDNLIILYFFWELIGLCSYALIGFFNKTEKAADAGIKALVTTKLGDIGLLIGIFILSLGAMSAGASLWESLSIRYLIQHALEIPIANLTIAGFCLIIGAMGKSAQVPLHVWLPDAMEAPTPVSALIHAATLVNAGVYLLARTMPLFVIVNGWTHTIVWIGAITAIFGASCALVENDLKKTLAYSTVSQLGYMMFAIGLGSEGLIAGTFHLMNHAIFKALLFLGAGWIIHSVGTRDMRQMGGLGKNMRLVHGSMVIGGLCLAGLIPLSGFWSKDLIFEIALEKGQYFPLVVVVITAAFTFIYTIRMLGMVFYGKSHRHPHVHDAWQITMPLLVLSVGAIFSWLSFGAIATAYHSYGYAGAHAVSIFEFVSETLTSPSVLLSIGAICLGLIIYSKRGYLKENALLKMLGNLASTGYGIDRMYLSFIRGFETVAFILRRFHTRQLSYNVCGIVLGLMMMFFLLRAVGAR